MLQFMWSQRVGHDWVTELKWETLPDTSLSNLLLTFIVDIKYSDEWAVNQTKWCFYKKGIFHSRIRIKNILDKTVYFYFMDTQNHEWFGFPYELDSRKNRKLQPAF